VRMQRGPLILVRIIEEVLERKNSAYRSITPASSAVRTRCIDDATPSTHKFWNYLRLQAAVVRPV
jgi:hypothetical protein